MNELTREEIGGRFSESWGLLASVPSLPHPLPAPFPFLLSPQFSRDQNLYSRDKGTLATQANVIIADMFYSMKVRTTPTPASYVNHPTQPKCIATGCTMLADHHSLYCSLECVQRY